MITDGFVTHQPVTLRPDPARLVIKPFLPAEAPPGKIAPDNARARRIVERVLAFDPATRDEELQRVRESLSPRYHAIDAILLRRFAEVNGVVVPHCEASRDQALLIGAYFSEEYAFEAAALFNPSIVPHFDQTGLAADQTRIILSLRAVGEGHLSSITFRTGIAKAAGDIVIDPPAPLVRVPKIDSVAAGGGKPGFVRLTCASGRCLSEVVLFPVTPAQRHGIEDLRMVRLREDDGTLLYYGTYTAFSGQDIRQELLVTRDFNTFELHPLQGSATVNKGMALFPRRIDGRYAMLGRADHESIWYLTSLDLHRWDHGERIILPRYAWELVQLGNAGSPIEIDEGWLVMAHGVGAVRNYCIGAFLLDKRDPSRLLARTARPLIRPTEGERFGYVPNVAYSCGAMVLNRTLILPYALADSITTFAMMPLDRLLAAMD